MPHADIVLLVFVSYEFTEKNGGGIFRNTFMWGSKIFFCFNSAVIWLLWQFEVVDWRKLNCDLFEAVRNGVLIHSDLQVLALTSVVQQVLNCWWYYILTVEVKGKQELTLRIALIFWGYSFKVSTCQFDLKTGYK